jgi:S-formylglutathione hydrolase FrmB
MHDDLLDGLEDLIGRGWIDRERVGIFGGSYGGYAALVGAAFTPDVFRCAVDYVGPSNLITMLESFPRTGSASPNSSTSSWAIRNATGTSCGSVRPCHASMTSAYHC